MDREIFGSALHGFMILLMTCQIINVYQYCTPLGFTGIEQSYDRPDTRDAALKDKGNRPYI